MELLSVKPMEESISVKYDTLLLMSNNFWSVHSLVGVSVCLSVGLPGLNRILSASFIHHLHTISNITYSTIEIP